LRVYGNICGNEERGARDRDASGRRGLRGADKLEPHVDGRTIRERIAARADRLALADGRSR
jgi:hypothetical protein